MTTQANAAVRALTEKEKQTLRLIVRGHDAKSVARSLDLSVHTINERLRDARRKMAVSSSREAARLLLEAEGGGTATTPELLGDSEIGEDARSPRIDQGTAPVGGARRPGRRSLIIGVCLMSLLLGLLALTTLPQAGSVPPQTADAATIPEVVDTARQFLVLGDQGRCADAYRLTGAPFHKLNTLQVWIKACETVRGPLGAMLARDLIGEEELPAPPSGYEVVKFRTRFANKAEAVETVSLDREDGEWRVVGVTVG